MKSRIPLAEEACLDRCFNICLDTLHPHIKGRVFSEEMSVEILYEITQSLHAEWKTRIHAKESDILDSYRLTLEPHVYNVLAERYSGMLQTHWTSYRPPKTSTYAFVIVERRCHPNFGWILRNMAWAGPHMAVHIFCSDLNVRFLRALLGDKADAFNLHVVFQGNPSRERGKKEVDNLLSDPRTYEMIDSEYILTMEMDCFLRKKIPDSLFQGGYWGCPWAWKLHEPGGGGITIRHIPTMILLCQEYRNLEEDLPCSQDAWISKTLMERGIPYPDESIRISYLMENIPSRTAVGVHQFWTYVRELPEDTSKWCEIVSDILTLSDM